MNSNVSMGVRNIALVGSYSSGKTTLLESLLYVSGAIPRKGRVQDGNTVSDASAEARARQMSVEVSVAGTEYKGVHFTFLDCPGSIEFQAETYRALAGVDAAVVVCDPEPDKVVLNAPLLRFLDRWQIPHLLFINKMDRVRCPLTELVAALQSVSSRPLVLQQYPLNQGEALTGFIDLVEEQAYRYRVGAAADPVALPETLVEPEQAARAGLLEVLADFDDHLLEALLEAVEPPPSEIEQNLKRDLEADLIVPVLIGMADRDFGVRPLIEALYREAPEAATTARRRGIEPGEGVLAQVLKTYCTAQGGKLSLVRVWRGRLQDGAMLGGTRVGGLYRLFGSQQLHLQGADSGEVVALGRLDGVKTGDRLGAPDSRVVLVECALPPPVFALAVSTIKRQDEVKLNQVAGRLLEEDPGLGWEQRPHTRELLLWAQGEVHLQVTLDRLERKFNLPLKTGLPQVLYKETIRRPAQARGRYKHQTGGHGQFADVHLDIQPLPRGEGIRFAETIVGGVVPRQYIPGVEAGVREYLERGPLGFEVVDVAVTLTNGSYHSVDSSEQAFKQAARLAMQTGMASGQPLLLEPVAMLEAQVPSECTSRVLRMLSGRRAQILGYDAYPEWSGWDCISAYLSEAEMQDLIVELRSLTQGLGHFVSHYDHLQEAPARTDECVQALR